MKGRCTMNALTMCLFFAVFATICWMKTKWPWLANLPGDLKIPMGNGQLVVPLATCLITSVIVTIVLLVVGKKP